MSKKWWYVQGGRSNGPVDNSMMHVLLFNGSLGNQHWVWTQDLPGWTRIGDVAELLAARRGVAPTTDPQPDPTLPLPDPTASPPARPLSRALAQFIDVNLCSLIVGVVAGIALGLAGATNIIAQADTVWGRLIFAILVTPIALLGEAPLLARFGTTPGKAILGVRVFRADGSKLDMRGLLRRQFRLWGSGWAYGIPFLNLLAFFASRSRLREGKQTVWDEEYGYVVLERDPGFLRPSIGLILFLLMQYGTNAYQLLEKKFGNGPDSQVTATEPARTPLESWRNPVTGVEVKLDPGWTMEARPREVGATDYWFQSAEPRGSVLMIRAFREVSFVDYAHKFFDQGELDNVDSPLIEPKPGRPSCIGVTLPQEEDGKPTGLIQEFRLCSLASGEVWKFRGAWKDANDPARQRVGRLLDHLQETVR